MTQPPYGEHDPYRQQPPAPYGPPQHGYPPQAYPPPGYGYRPPGTNGLAIASLVLGIIWIYWLGSVLALVFGYVAKKQIRETGQAGGGMATAGIVLGWVGVGILALFLLFGLVFGLFGGSWSDSSGTYS